MSLSTVVDVFPYFKNEIEQPLPPHLRRIEPEEMPVARDSGDEQEAVPDYSGGFEPETEDDGE
jgi:hypothetical protein